VISPVTEEIAVPATLVAVYDGGILPAKLVVLTKDTIRAAGITQ
jgi:hypothetical protein